MRAMKPTWRTLLFTMTHIVAIGGGFALGIYLLPILTAPASPETAELVAIADSALFTGEFTRDLEDSDTFHWGEGRLSINAANIALEGRLAPGPDYRLYLSPQFVETESDFERFKPQMVQVGHVRTFENFSIPVPEHIDPADFNSAIVWCESFGQFISAARYR